MAPGFFRKYAYCGALTAIEEEGCYSVNAATGASAGAIVAGVLGSGKRPLEMKESLFALRREDMWDPSFFFIFGLLVGFKLRQTLEINLSPVKHMGDAKVKIAVTAFDLLRFRTRILTEGSLARNVAASCAVPIMFQPVFINALPHYDGGIYDVAGMYGLEKVHDPADDGLVVNLMASRKQVKHSVLPPAIKNSGATILTIVLENVPHVSPFSMTDGGPVAYERARAGLKKAFNDDSPLDKLGPGRYLAIVDCSLALEEDSRN
eukprot:gene22301-26903_t